MGIRKATNLDFSNSIIIIDEAHHILNAAEESLSFDFKVESLDRALEGLGIIAVSKVCLDDKGNAKSDVDIMNDVI
jgi:Rad3-related DNA helicase